MGHSSFWKTQIFNFLATQSVHLLHDPSGQGVKQEGDRVFPVEKSTSQHLERISVYKAAALWGR